MTAPKPLVSSEMHFFLFFRSFVLFLIFDAVHCSDVRRMPNVFDAPAELILNRICAETHYVQLTI
jgi:hypothetical protein